MVMVSADDKPKLDQFIEGAKEQFQEIDDRRESLRDLCKALAQELGLEPRQLMGAARSAYKGDMADKKEDMEAMENILTITGHS